MSDEGIHLHPIEATALAQLLIIRQLNDADWIVWEDVPELNEQSFELVEKAIATEAGELLRALKRFEEMHRVDSREIFGRAS